MKVAVVNFVERVVKMALEIKMATIVQIMVTPGVCLASLFRRPCQHMHNSWSIYKTFHCKVAYENKLLVGKLLNAR